MKILYENDKMQSKRFLSVLRQKLVLQHRLIWFLSAGPDKYSPLKRQKTPLINGNKSPPKLEKAFIAKTTNRINAKTPLNFFVQLFVFFLQFPSPIFGYLLY